MSERMTDERLAEEIEVSLLATTDAKVWAEAWYRIFQKPDLLPDGDYVGWMIGWFANAFAAQEFVDAKRIRELEAEVARYQRSAKRTEEVFAVMKQDLSQSREETRSLHTRLEAAEAKLRGANAEIERQKGLVRNYLETIEGNELDIAGLLEKLRAVGGLPGKLRKDADNKELGNSDYRLGKRHSADELEALLKTNDEPRTRPIQGGYLEKDTTTGEVHEPTTERDWTSDAWSK